MISASFFFFFQNIFAITSLFWFLSFIGDKYFRDNNSKYSEEVFECGFFITSSITINFNFNFFIICSLLILYDIEFIIMLPYTFNFEISTIIEIFYFLSFYFLVITSFIIDWEFSSIIWGV